VAGFTKNSSAAESGVLQPGDVLLQVDGEPAMQKSLREVAMMILGPPGTTVTLRLLPVSSER
jgi:C-terminal processing protease CtpA/Prc